MNNFLYLYIMAVRTFVWIADEDERYIFENQSWSNVINISSIDESGYYLQLRPGIGISEIYSADGYLYDNWGYKVQIIGEKIYLLISRLTTFTLTIPSNLINNNNDISAIIGNIDLSRNRELLNKLHETNLISDLQYNEYMETFGSVKMF